MYLAIIFSDYIETKRKDKYLQFILEWQNGADIRRRLTENDHRRCAALTVAFVPIEMVNYVFHWLRRWLNRYIYLLIRCFIIIQVNIGYGIYEYGISYADLSEYFRHLFRISSSVLWFIFYSENVSRSIGNLLKPCTQTSFRLYALFADQSSATRPDWF